ncbi:hypothetical protein RPALISO_199 [Ruegeria phage RpAliso]|nr:hypothetical protein RPALISO_199 [Ruegeria phage RpAliso]
MPEAVFGDDDPVMVLCPARSCEDGICGLCGGVGKVPVAVADRYSRVMVDVPRTSDLLEDYQRGRRRAAKEREGFFIPSLPMQKRILEALQNVMGHIDTPIARRRLGINENQPEWLTEARKVLRDEEKSHG